MSKNTRDNVTPDYYSTLPKQPEQEQHPPIDIPEPIGEYDEAKAKQIISNAVLSAIQTVQLVMTAPSASASERLSAARTILDLGFGKNPTDLQVVQKQNDVATKIFEAIQRGRTLGR